MDQDIVIFIDGVHDMHFSEELIQIAGLSAAANPPPDATPSPVCPQEEEGLTFSIGHDDVWALPAKLKSHSLHIALCCSLLDQVPNLYN